MIPAFMLLTAVRIIQDTVRTIKENEKDLGSSIPTIDLDAYEQEYLRSKSAENGGGDHV
jgi:hypothetical protein